MDDAIFEKIYDETARPLWAFIARVSGDGGAADDILQEAYLRFLRSPPREISLVEAKPYLYKIATNLIYDRFRRLKRQGGTEVEISDLADTAGDKIEMGAEMMQVFSRLKQQERSLLWLAYVEGYDHSEIAAIMKLNKLSVRVLMYRARQRLAKLLDG